DHFRDADLDGAAVDVRGHVRAALVLRQRQARRVPAVGVLPGRGVERDAEVVAELRAGPPLGLILVKRAAPVAVERALRVRRKDRQREADGDTQDIAQTMHARESITAAVWARSGSRATRGSSRRRA